MKFSTPLYNVLTVKKKTQAQGWSRVREGDFLQFHIELERTRGASGGGLYSLGIQIEHRRIYHNTPTPIPETTKINVWENSQNQFLNNLSKFELIDRNR